MAAAHAGGRQCSLKEQMAAACTEARARNPLSAYVESGEFEPEDSGREKRAHAVAEEEACHLCPGDAAKRVLRTVGRAHEAAPVAARQVGG